MHVPYLFECDCFFASTCMMQLDTFAWDGKRIYKGWASEVPCARVCAVNRPSWKIVVTNAEQLFFRSRVFNLRPSRFHKLSGVGVTLWRTVDFVPQAFTQHNKVAFVIRLCAQRQILFN